MYVYEHTYTHTVSHTQTQTHTHILIPVYIPIYIHIYGVELGIHIYIYTYMYMSMYLYTNVCERVPVFIEMTLSRGVRYIEFNGHRDCISRAPQTPRTEESQLDCSPIDCHTNAISTIEKISRNSNWTPSTRIRNDIDGTWSHGGGSTHGYNTLTMTLSGGCHTWCVSICICIWFYIQCQLLELL